MQERDKKIIAGLIWLAAGYAVWYGWFYCLKWATYTIEAYTWTAKTILKVWLFETFVIVGVIFLDYITPGDWNRDEWKNELAQAIILGSLIYGVCWIFVTS